MSAGGLASPVLGALADHAGTTVALAVLLVWPVLAGLLALALVDPPAAPDDARTGSSRA